MFIGWQPVSSNTPQSNAYQAGRNLGVMVIINCLPFASQLAPYPRYPHQATAGAMLLDLYHGCKAIKGELLTGAAVASFTAVEGKTHEFA